MKTKQKEQPKTTSATITSTARLTIQGQTFEMPLAELEDLHAKIGAALGKKSTSSELEEVRKMFEDQSKDRERNRPPYPPMWPALPYQPPSNRPQRFPLPWEQPILCEARNSFSANGCDIQMGKHSDQRDRF